MPEARPADAIGFHALTFTLPVGFDSQGTASARVGGGEADERRRSVFGFRQTPYWPGSKSNGVRKRAPQSEEALGEKGTEECTARRSE